MVLQHIVALNFALRDYEIQHTMKSEVGQKKLQALHQTQDILLSFIIGVKELIIPT